MYTISNIIADIGKGCTANNMVEDKFSYRIIFFINEDGIETKHYIDTAYGDLRKSLESVIRENLTLTNSIVIAQTSVLKDGECVCLQSRSYPFSLSEYFLHITGRCKNSSKNRNMMYG